MRNRIGNPLVATMQSMISDPQQEEQAPIQLYRSFYRFVGTLEGALMLNQLLYWSVRPSVVQAGGWFHKSDEEWQKEICASRHSVRTTVKKLEDMGILQTEIRLVNKRQKTFYRINEDVLEVKWERFLEDQHLLRSKSVDDENEQSIVRDQTTEEPMSENGQDSVRTQTSLICPNPDKYNIYKNTTETTFIADAKDEGKKSTRKSRATRQGGEKEPSRSETILEAFTTACLMYDKTPKTGYRWTERSAALADVIRTNTTPSEILYVISQIAKRFPKVENLHLSRLAENIYAFRPAGKKEVALPPEFCTRYMWNARPQSNEIEDVDGELDEEVIRGLSL